MTEKTHKAIAVVDKESLPERLHPVVQAALAQSTPDPATLRELLAVQREWEAGEARRAYTSALVRLKKDLPTVVGRDKQVDFKGSKGRVTYTHTSLAAAMDAVTGPLTQHGFSLAWVPGSNNGGVKVTCRLTHAAGHSEECTLEAPPDKSGLKSAAQGIASTITLLQRYTALSLLGIATADMVDPTGEAPADHIDSERNLRAVKAVVDAGRSKEDAESIAGKKMQEWTAADLAKVRKWYEATLTIGGAKRALDKCETVAELDALISGETRKAVLDHHAERRRALAADEAAEVFGGGETTEKGDDDGSTENRNQAEQRSQDSAELGLRCAARDPDDPPSF